MVSSINLFELLVIVNIGTETRSCSIASYIKRKCGADFVYLPGGCGKALKKINDIQYPTPV